MSQLKGMLEAIEMALEAEQKARQFYLDALNNVSDRRGRDLLQQLADFENNHYRKLTELKASLQNTGTFIEYAGTHFKPYPAQIESEVSGVFEQNKEEILNILNLAINAESKAAQNYRKLAAETADETGQQMFLQLAEEEVSHRRILSDEYYQLLNERGFWVWGD
jgi:rubrerythrin